LTLKLFKSTWLNSRIQEYAAKFTILNGNQVVRGLKEKCSNLYDESLPIDRIVLFCQLYKAKVVDIEVIYLL